MTCCSCGGPVESVCDLGSHRVPDFPLPGSPPAPRYPLHLVICMHCTLLQLSEVTPRQVLYHERYGFQSGINEAIRADLADVVRHALDVVPRPARWLDIACNDGTLLASVPSGTERTGIDPMTQFAGQAKEHADRIVGDFFSPSYFRPGEFDVITSVSMFYDLADPNEFVQGVREVLGTHGVWVIQQNYALDMVRLNAIDNIVHEHVTYFSVRSLWPLLARHGLEISEVSYSAVNGGCFRALVSHKGRRPVGDSVYEAAAKEEDASLFDPATLSLWAASVRGELGRTRDLLDWAAADDRRVQLYGASTRGGTILQLIGADPGTLECAVERNPAKVGRVMAAAGGLPIISESAMRADPPDLLLVSPWFFRPVFVEREAAYLQAGGRMIFPLPRFGVVG